MKLDQYLKRINYSGSLDVSLNTLERLHQCHLLAVPYETYDVFLMHSLDLDLERIYHKIVLQNRGGWCYEMNTLFAWVLKKIGFDLIEMAGYINRCESGDTSIGSHLSLAVELKHQLWLVDVGYGDGIFSPVMIKPHRFQQRAFSFRLEKIDDSFWRFHNHPLGCCHSFDFEIKPVEKRLLDSKSLWLSTSPDSPFSKVPFCYQYTATGYTRLFGRKLVQVTPEASYHYWLGSMAEYQQIVKSLFNLNLDSHDLEYLWHQILFSDRS